MDMDKDMAREEELGAGRAPPMAPDATWNRGAEQGRAGGEGAGVGAEHAAHSHADLHFCPSCLLLSSSSDLLG